MHSFYEFRLNEKYSHLLLKPTEGERLDENVRKVVLRDDDPRLAEMAKITEKVEKKRDEYFFAGWDIRRKYSKAELERAEIFHLSLRPFFEPAGEECGTIYDETTACPHCGAGRRQVSDLVLDMRKIPKSRDITSTIADEWIVSQRLAELMLEARLTGFELRPIRHKARYQDDAIQYHTVPTGRKVLEMAKKLGYKESTWKFSVWINHPKRQPLLHRIESEHAAICDRRAASRGKLLPVWYQLVVTESIGATLPPTTFGIRPFNLDSAGKYRCPLGHSAGLNLLSEVSLARSNWDGSDLMVTENLAGWRIGLFVPSPLLLVSPRFLRLLQNEKIKAYRSNIAHLV